MPSGTWWEIWETGGVKSSNGWGGRGEKQAAQWVGRVELWRAAARGRRGGTRSLPIGISSLACLSIFRLRK